MNFYEIGIYDTFLGFIPRNFVAVEKSIESEEYVIAIHNDLCRYFVN